MSKTRRRALKRAIETALVHCETGSLAEAETTLHKASVLAGEAPAVVYFHALILIALERWETALSRLNALEGVLPRQLNVQFNRATCLVSLGRHEDARAVLEADDQLRAHSLSYLLLARIAAREGNLPQSANLLREACRSGTFAASAVLQRPRLTAIVEGRLRTDDADQQTAARRVH